MPAKHKSINYKPLDIPNPFQQGQDRAYADILLDKFKEIQLWRRLSFVYAGLFAVSLILFFVSVSQQNTVPVLVNVMPSGESQYLGEVRQGGNIQIPESAIHFDIRKFVTNLRSVSTDYQVVFNNIDECFIMVTNDFVPILRQMILANSPFELVGQIRRTVEIESVLNITGRSYQINWNETVVDSSSAQRRTRYRGVVTIRLITPTDATIRRNPLGIYIENFEMTEL
jgi:type IV secretion system protein VirB5